MQLAMHGCAIRCIGTPTQPRSPRIKEEHFNFILVRLPSRPTAVGCMMLMQRCMLNVACFILVHQESTTCAIARFGDWLRPCRTDPFALRLQLIPLCVVFYWMVF